jgi:hypothetical protein
MLLTERRFRTLSILLIIVQQSRRLWNPLQIVHMQNVRGNTRVIRTKRKPRVAPIFML